MPSSTCDVALECKWDGNIIVMRYRASTQVEYQCHTRLVRMRKRNATQWINDDLVAMGEEGVRRARSKPVLLLMKVCD